MGIKTNTLLLAVRVIGHNNIYYQARELISGTNFIYIILKIRSYEKKTRKNYQSMYSYLGLHIS